MDIFADSESQKAYFNRLKELFSENLSMAKGEELDLCELVKSLVDLEFGSLFELSSDSYMSLLMQSKD